MPTNTPSRAKLPIMIAAWLLVAVIALVGSGLAGNAHAQAGSDVIPSITLDSNQPGQLVITWATPEQAPTDYRIRWANTNLGFPSYSAANEPERGNEYPLGDVNMLTLSNLTPGDSYKVQIRSRYYNADGSVHESSGPWTSTATQRVKDNPPAAPTSLTASLVEHNTLTLTWNDPQAENITGYRVLRGTDAGTLSTLANTQRDSTSYTDSTVEPETTYRYAVVALSQDGNSVQSSTLSATTPAEPSSGEEEETREPPKKEDPPQRVGPRQSTTTTFISNTGQTSNTDLTTTRATAFTTGTSTYTLSSVGIHLSAQTGTPTPLVQIYGDTSGNPGSVVATLSNPGSITDNVVNTYTDPANTMLSGSTTYWVVTSNSAAVNGQGFRVRTTDTNNLDSGTAAGWTIGSALYKTNITLTSWLTSTSRHLFEIRGTRTDAATGTPAITAPNVFRVPAVLGVDLSGITDTDGVTNIATNATYKWQRFNAAGTTLETDSIGTGSTYTLTHTDATKTLKVVVNFTDDASNSEGPLTSAATSAITAAATDCNAPTYVGGATQLGPARTVTIAQGNDSIHGLAYGFRKSDAYGSLDNTTFTTGTAYEILGIYNVKTLTYIRLDKALTRPNQRQLALHVCDQAYSFGPELSDFGYSFSNPHQDWSPYAERTFYLSQDTTAPTFVSATVNGTTLVITLNEPLDAALNLANSAFTVKKNGSSTPISSTAPVISGRMVTLTLTRAVSTSDTNVLVSYNKPTSGAASKLRDTFHNETATFTDQVVSNTAATGAPTISGIAQVGQTLTASTTSISDTNGLPSVFKYQWKRVDANGTSNSTNIGTDSATYTLTDSEVGKKVLVEVSFTDNANNREGPLVSAAFPSSGTVSAAPSEVPSSWSLKPTGLAVGDQFRLIFLSSTKRNATSTDIADYNTFVQERAAAGHAGIQSYSTGFRVVGCTGAVDARDNTDTTGRGVPIYWLDGTKVADNYTDFYDESWDDEINDKNESGTDAHDTSQSDNYPFTGCMDDGTESFAGATRPRSLGAPLGFVRIGRLNSSGTLQDPIDGNDVADTAATRPMYGLSAVFQVVAASTDATLSALTVSPKDITGFATDRSTRYEVGVASTVTQATITATTNDSAATVGYSTTDADDSTSGHQVDLSAGRNRVTVTVTAEDTTTTQTHTISINRGVDDDFGWKAADDFDGLITAGNDTPSGPWSDETTMWVSDYVDDKIYAYDLTTKARDASKDFDTLSDADNENPDGIWSNNITMWVSDYEDSKLYAYSMATKARDPGKDITTAAASAGIWSDGTTMWVANQSLVKIQAYTLATGVRDAGKDFDTLTAAGNEYPGGIWSNTTTMWVTDQTDNKIYAYNMASKAHDAGKDFDTLIAADNDRGVGIWANTDTMWVADLQDDKIYSYNMPAIAANAAPTVANAIPDQMATVGTEFSYTFLANTFNDVDATDTLTYTATKGDGAVLPTWLMFAAGTRTFSGTPTDAETFSVKVTASDGTASVTDEFDITVNAAASTAVWTATLTPAATITGFIGCYDNSCATGLSDDDFTYDSTDYTITVLYVITDSSRLTITLDPDITTATNSLTLVVGTSSFAFASANTATTDTRTWTSTGLSWTIGTDVFVKLIEAANTPAAGAPAITAPNVFRVPAVLGVDLSSITDTDGVTNIATNATYKWQRFAANGTTLETDSIGTDATYTLTDTDATKTLKVVVSFTDDANNSEAPLTSAATSAITASASCATPTYVGGATQIWTAKVGVGKNSDFYGYYDDTTLDFGSLDQTRFSISSNNYRVDRIFTQPGPSLAFSMKSDFTSDEQKTLALHICDQAFAFSVAGAPSSGSTYAFLGSDFPGADLDWSTHAERTIYLSQDTTAPTFTAATVNGSTLVVTLSEDLGTAASLVNSAFTVKKGASGTTQTLSGTPAISGSTVTLTLATAVTATDTAVKVAYAKPTSGSANKLRDKFGNETATFPDQAVTNNTTTTTETPANWSLKPTALNTGDQFRLIFLSSTKRNADVTTISTYNTFVQNRAAAGHTAIRAYSAGFRVVGCTADVDARDNTSTTFTTEDKGVPIYWLNGAKVADEYEDFYDGDWDDEVNDKDESGTNGLDISLNVNSPFTGCAHNGTEALDGSISQGFAAVGGTKIGRPNSTGSGHGPLSSNAVGTTTNTRPMYGLSEVFQVAEPTNTPATGEPTISGTAAAGQTLTASTAGISDTDGLPSAFTYQWKRVDSDGMSNPTNIGADSATYTLTDDEVGKKVLVEVSFTDNATNREGPLASAAHPSTGTVRAADNTAPTVTSIERQDPTALLTNSDTPTWRVTFSEAVKNVDGTDFTIAGTAATPTATAVTLVPGGYDVTPTGGDIASLTGTITLAFASGQNIADTADNELAATAPTGTDEPTFDLDNTIPRFDSGTANGAMIVLTFSEALDPDSLPPGAAFDISTSTSVTVDNVSIAGTMVTLTVTPAILVDQHVVVSNNAYDGAGYVPLKDFAGNQVLPAAQSPSYTLTNNTPIGPTTTFVAEAGDGRARLVWTNPEGIPGLLGYQYRYVAGTSVPSGTGWTGTGSAEDRTVLLSGLTNGTAYTFEVRAVRGGKVGATATVSATPQVAVCALDLGDRREVWSATMTVGGENTGPFVGSVRAGYRNGLYGSLSANNDTFTIGDASYTINDIYASVGGDGIRRRILLKPANTGRFTPPVKVAIQLHWCGESSGFEEPISRGYLASNPNDADWSIYNTRELALSLPTNNPATGKPAITGAPLIGQTLTATKGNVADPDGLPSTFTYEWKRVDSDGVSNPTNIGIDSATYTLTTSEVNKRILVEVSFTDDLSGAESRTSDVHPSSGTVTVGGSVALREDSYYAFDNSDFSYAISSGTLASLTITEMPASGTLTKGGRPINNLPDKIPTTGSQRRTLLYRPPPDAHGTPYTSFKFKVNEETTVHTMTINVTSVNDPAYGQVFITGTTQMGYSLTAFTSAMGDRDGIPRDQLSYQWKRYAANGTTFEANIGTNSSTYTLTVLDVGKKIRLEVSYVDGGGTTEVRLSPAFPYIATQTIGEATFISTLGMAGDSSRSFTTQEQGQVFTTGGHPNGYTVTSVVIISEDAGGDDVALKICEVDESLHPTAVCTDLTAPGMYPAGPLVFTAPSGTTLTGGRTNYMVVFDSPGDEEVLLDAHVSDGYGSNSLPGFSIRNRIHYKTGTGWQELSYRQGIRMAVLGTINP